ncbi:hypothetical protein CFC21_075622 [Triticum aestivum]|uniref:Uncharacterized protein n=2 Tax=Triticum aestivum TaxID=4565 RepID=A0A3B6ML36_WHEAT|nr:hypothetical protein CFC21_075622 [Triticum aestivum]
MAPLTSKLCWRSCCHCQPEDASCAGTVPRFVPGTAAGASRSLSMNRTVRCSCQRVNWSCSGRITNTTTPMSTRTALAGEDDVEESHEPPAGGGQLTEVPELGSDGGFR